MSIQPFIYAGNRMQRNELDSKMKDLPREGFSEGQWSLNGNNWAEREVCRNGFALL